MNNFATKKLLELREKFIIEVLAPHPDGISHTTMQQFGGKYFTIPGIEQFLLQTIAEAQEEKVQEIREKIVLFAIEGKDTKDEWKGIDLYSKILNYLHSLSVPEKKGNPLSNVNNSVPRSTEKEEAEK